MVVVAKTTGADPTERERRLADVLRRGVTEAEVPTRVLVLGMAHQDGTTLASELYPVAAACGQTADQVRSCLRRLVTENLFTRSGEGRHATFRATDAGLRALGSSLERTRPASAQDA